MPSDITALILERLRTVEDALAKLQTSERNIDVVALRDAVAAPGSVTGIGKLFIDNADGLLKIRYDDGTTVTLGAANVLDNAFTVQDNGDPTKQMQFQASGITAGQTRTLTVPNASGTLALLGLAQTFSALQTFSAGLSLGNETLATYDEGTWTPEITGSTGAPTITYVTQTGKYTRIGNVVFFAFRVLIDTFSGGSGQLRVSLPSTPVTVGTASPLRFIGLDFTGVPISITFLPTTSGAYGLVVSCVDNGAETIEAVTILAAGDVVQSSGIYFV